jgi:oligopeptide/dipeptide ABC transporter ATP-binding protein
MRVFPELRAFDKLDAASCSSLHPVRRQLTLACSGFKSAMPTNRRGAVQKLTPIEGAPPDLFDAPHGCGYYTRCPYAMEVCEATPPIVFDVDRAHQSRYWLHHKDCLQQVTQIYRP